jgi:hypothetical protein
MMIYFSHNLSFYQINRGRPPTCLHRRAWRRRVSFVSLMIESRSLVLGSAKMTATSSAAYTCDSSRADDILTLISILFIPQMFISLFV